MTAAILLIAGLVAISSLAAAKSNPALRSCKHEPNAFRCVTVLRTADADTIVVDIPDVPAILGKGIRVRVAGIDSPEIHSESACEATIAERASNFTRLAIAGASQVDLENIRRDKFFRILADVVIDGKSLGESLIKAKFAYAYKGGKKTVIDWCKLHNLPSGESTHPL